MQLPGAFDLSGKVALVTGGAGLLGTQHAHALGEAGARVVLGDIDERAAHSRAEELNGSLGAARVSAVRLDVTDPADVRRAHAEAVSRLGDVHILINNAAIDAKVAARGMVETSRFENFALEQWQREFRVGLTGAFLCSQVFGGTMARRGSGVILNIASDLSVFAPDQRIYRKEGLAEDMQPVKPVTYSAIKHGLIGLTRYLATYWADKGVRVNALSPGGVYTDQPEEFVARLSRLVPLGRMARRDEYRAAIVFLCSDASTYMTGQNVVMDGGRSAW
jgi:NAD(P)-dependent dehydrogenase (short-subunit alcohol dehydrogenase family)